MRTVYALGTVYVTKGGRIQIYVRSPFDKLLTDLNKQVVVLEIKIPESDVERDVLNFIVEKVSGRSPAKSTRREDREVQRS